jgi:hypothetical protein
MFFLFFPVAEVEVFFAKAVGDVVDHFGFSAV